VRIYRCPACAQTVFHPNTACDGCGARLHWDPGADAFLAGGTDCANRGEIGCNWAAPGPGALCHACAMTVVIPDTFHGDNRALWTEAEASKRRVLATIGRWGWFAPSDPGPMPRFRMLSEATRHGATDVVMAHSEGLITINVTEADLVERLERAEEFGERLRTMTGHFRHELAHFLFERLRDRPGFLEAVRALMGDERSDYPAALARYHADGPPPGWASAHITRYAAAHPHEDWAETVTHLLHLTDILDSAVAAGMAPPGLAEPAYDAYAEPDPDRLIALGLEVSLAVNHINRSVGRQDLYPFVLTPAVRAKLAFVHGWIQRAG